MRTLLILAVAVCGARQIDAQELPEGALASILSHADSAYHSEAGLALELDGLADPAAARVIANQRGVNSGRRAELVECEAVRGCLIRGGGLLVRLDGVEPVEAGQELTVRVFVRETVSLPGRPSWLFGALRELTLSGAEGWRVISDRVIART